MGVRTVLFQLGQRYVLKGTLGEGMASGSQGLHDLGPTCSVRFDMVQHSEEDILVDLRVPALENALSLGCHRGC
jgi:hypothetical protein